MKKRTANIEQPTAQSEQLTVNSQQQIETMLELLRAGVLDRDPVLDSDVNVDWDDLMDRASKQGILAWVYDGICKLPKEQQPPRQQRINWALSAQEIWDRYAKQKEVLADMVKVCEENDMRLLLLKGIGLSELYPKPESRPSGDIDVYFFDDFEKGNTLFANSEHVFINKHEGFDYRGAHVENHLTPLDTDTSQRALIESYLEKRLSLSKITKDGYYILDVETNLLYLLAHLIRHYRSWDLFPVRCLIDISVFLWRNKNSINVDKCLVDFTKLNLVKPFCFVIYFASWFLEWDDALDGWYSALPYRKMDINIGAIMENNLLDCSILKNRFWVSYFQHKIIGSYLGLSSMEFIQTFWRRKLSVSVKPLFGLSENSPSLSM